MSMILTTRVRRPPKILHVSTMDIDFASVHEPIAESYAVEPVYCRKTADAGLFWEWRMVA